MRAARVSHVLETALYVDDMERAVEFYQEVLGLRPLMIGERMSAFSAGEETVVLLFHRGATAEGLETEGGWIPPHGGQGAQHVAFAIPLGALGVWREFLEEVGVPIESEVRWPRGGVSLYIRDPDGHSVELATPGVWTVY